MTYVYLTPRKITIFLMDAKREAVTLKHLVDYFVGDRQDMHHTMDKLEANRTLWFQNLRICTVVVLYCFFLSCKANARVKFAKTGHGPQSSTLVVICVVRLLFVLFYVLLVCKCVLPPGDNPTAVNKSININYCCHFGYSGQKLHLTL